MDFMDNQEVPPIYSGTKTCTLGSGFVMEEEMLESDKQAHMDTVKHPQIILKEDLKTAPAANSAEPTSRQIKTNEARQNYICFKKDFLSFIFINFF